MSMLRLLALLSVALTLLLIGRARPVQAQAHDADLCGFTTPPPSPRGTFFDGDTVRAMAVFVRFRDDTWNGIRSWPLETDSTDLPGWAYGLFAPTPDPATFADSSFSAYFYEQTTGPSGRFTVYGDIQPQNDLGEPFLYVSKHDNSYYWGGNAGDRGYGYLTQEILDYLVYERGVDLGLYNSNPQDDDVVDQVFLFVRSEDLAVPYRGCATLNGCSGVAGDPGELTYPSASQGAVRIDWRFSGSHQFGYVPSWLGDDFYLYHHNVMAHEYGHDLWEGLIGHLGPITQNDVPAEEGRQQANALMIGGAHRVDYTISAYERILLDWIAPQELTTSQTAVAVGDLYTTGDYYEFTLDNGAADRTVYVENRQRISYFDSLRIGGDEFVADQGLLETGLLVTMSEVSISSRRDVLPVNNVLPPGLGDHIQTTTMYGPQTGENQLTPWTKPNINGCTGYAEDTYCDGSFVPSWHALDDIRYDADGVTMLFDYYEDFRTASTVTIRADSWMGAETAFAFGSEVRVTAGATLTIEDGADVTFDGGLTVEDGGTLVIEPGAAFAVGENTILLAESGGTVVVAPGAEVTVEAGAAVRGTPGAQLTVGAGATVHLGMKASVEASALTAVGTGASPILFTRLSSGDAWDRILLTGAADFAHDLQHVRIEGAEVGLDVQTRGSSPNVTGATLSNVRLVGNGIGLSTDYYDCDGACLPQRARLSMTHVLVEKSTTYGLYLRNADFSLSESTVRAGGGHGVFVRNATATAFFDNVVEDNGSNAGNYDGLRVEANGWVDFSGRGDVVGTGQPGRNRIARNDDHQVAYLSGAYLFMGAAGLGGDLNTVTELGTGCRVYNDSGSILEAENNYWGTASAPPSGYFCGSYSVDANPYLTADPTGGSGGGYRPAPGGDMLLASAAATAAANRGGDDDPIALLRERIRAVRAEVIEAPGAETAPALVRLLAGLHRLDVWDETGEAAATEQVLRTLRDHLTAADASGEGHPESLPPGLRRTAESAAVVALESALAEEDYERADGLLATFEPVVEDTGHALALGLSAVSVEEAHGRYEAALDRLGALMAVVGDGHDGLAEDLAYLVEVIAAKAETAGRGSDGAGEADVVANRSDDEAALPVAYALGPAYPNPAVAQVTVPFELPEASEVQVAVYDLLGRQVAVLAEGLREAGRHTARLDASGLSAGVYLVHARMEAQGGAVQAFTQKLTLVR